MYKIKNSLSAKVFLWMLSALTICSMAIYGIVMVIIPQQYTALFSSRINEEIKVLEQELNLTDVQTAEEKIYEFCIQNHAAALLQTGDQSLTFGSVEKISKEKNSSSVSVVLQLRDGESYLTVIASAATAEEINRTFLRMIPLISVIILLISAVSAWVCSRAIVRPVLKISHVSKKMAQMDMTWHCETGRSDELGILSDSLNTLSQKLTQSMGELEAANQKLRKEIETVQGIEKQRRDFFAAASHELKTPITILKGQIESMILGIGRYRDTARILPETLQEAEHMERLVSELLSISKLEMHTSVGRPDHIAVHEEAKKVTALLEPLAKEKRIAMHKTLQPVWIMGNATLFRKALHNIVSNAICHSPDESEVMISLTEKVLTVTNTGVMLPEEDIPELFTPFYRVEKSRNKETGGSGLGLYLVKSIFELHGFPFSIANGDRCVRFTVRFEGGPETEAKSNQNEIKA